jgi:hypothetical protein
MTKIGHGAAMGSQMQLAQLQGNEGTKDKEKGKFGQAMGKLADGTLNSLAAVAPMVPGGQLVGMAAAGLQELRGKAPSSLTGNQSDQLDKMWAMQRENQVFNLQYMQLQNEVQADNRRFSTLSNLMKVRHDTAKAAINNMHA